jgi:Tfp pilus assembly protein PilF
MAYLRGDDYGKAEAALRQVLAMTPGDPRPYHHLALRVFAPRKQFAQAKTIIEEGKRHGIDPYTLAMILAEAAQVTGERDEQQAALQQAVSLRPWSFDAHFQLGLFYVQGQNFDRAALSLRQAVEIDPQHAGAVYHLGIAEEGRYDFFAAEKTYTRAIALDPSNSEFRQRYEHFHTKMTQVQETRATQ